MILAFNACEGFARGLAGLVLVLTGGACRAPVGGAVVGGSPSWALLASRARTAVSLVVGHLAGGRAGRVNGRAGVAGHEGAGGSLGETELAMSAGRAGSSRRGILAGAAVAAGNLVGAAQSAALVGETLGSLAGILAGLVLVLAGLAADAGRLGSLSLVRAGGEVRARRLGGGGDEGAGGAFVSGGVGARGGL
jgi:hypothetical protein